MKNKPLILTLLLSVFLLAACSSVKNQEENMKKTALEITTAFVNGNAQTFINCLEPSVRANYPADQIVSASQALSSILGTSPQIDSLATLNFKDLTPVASVIVNYTNGSVEYLSAFDDKGKITSFIPVPLATEEIFTQSEIIEEIDSIPTPQNTK